MTALKNEQRKQGAILKSHNQIRTDIQALRGVAVLFVVFYHSKIFSLDAGFLGVDIFFVISGFLITGIIIKGIASGTFSFKNFYLRRAARLLPAAYATFFLTALGAHFFLSEQQLSDLMAQIVGSLTYTANIVLWQQSNYFAGESTLKPLLHIWSLSLEEQYYFCVPLLYFFTPKKYWKQATIALFFGSLTLCLIAVQIKPVATFYLLPTRAWELTIGALLAIYQFKVSRVYVSYIFWPALMVLIVTPIYSTGLSHPGIDAIIVCIATALIIAVRHPKADDYSVVKGLAFIGGFSYSLYLVHWPIFAFLNNAYVTSPSLLFKVIALVSSFTLGYLLYCVVEQPARKITLSLNKRRATALIILSVCICLIPYAPIVTKDNNLNYAELRQPNYGLSKDCNFDGHFNADKSCNMSENPDTLIWGDSFAMHLIPAIKAAGTQNIVQATSAMCGPLLNVAPVNDLFYTKDWAQKCINFNDSVIDYLETQKSIKNVVLSSQFFVYVKPNNWNKKYRLLKVVDNQQEFIASSVNNAVKALRATVNKLESMEKFVTIISPPPSSGFNIGACIEKKFTHKVSIGSTPNCQIKMENYIEYQQEVLDLLTQIDPNVNVIYLSEGLCNEDGCMTEDEGVPFYIDEGHLSIIGSTRLGLKMDLANKISQPVHGDKIIN